MRTIDLVREFHVAFGHPVEQRPTTSTEFYRILRVKLIAEELAELAQALGIKIDIEVAPAVPDDLKVAPKDVSNGLRKWVKVNGVHEASKVDLVETADALADLDYVVQGSNLTFGLPAWEIISEVHASNMSKLGGDGRPVLAPDGKVVKGPNYRAPDIAPILAMAAKGVK